MLALPERILNERLSASSEAMDSISSAHYTEAIPYKLDRVGTTAHGAQSLQLNFQVEMFCMCREYLNRDQAYLAVPIVTTGGSDHSQQVPPHPVSEDSLFHFSLASKSTVLPHVCLALRQYRPWQYALVSCDSTKAHAHKLCTF